MSGRGIFDRAKGRGVFEKALNKDKAESLVTQDDRDAVAALNASRGPTGRESVLSDVAAFAQTGSLNSGDQIAGLLSMLKGKGYGKGQQEAEKSLEMAQKESPVASAAGVLPHMAVGGAPTALGRILGAGAVGAASGALDSPGEASALDTMKVAGGSGLQSIALAGVLEGVS